MTKEQLSEKLFPISEHLNEYDAHEVMNERSAFIKGLEIAEDYGKWLVDIINDYGDLPDNSFEALQLFLTEKYGSNVGTI